MNIPDNVLFARIREVIGKEWIPIPDEKGYGGSGAPGKILEEQLLMDGGNSDSPDAGKWELKYHSGKALLTLFHLSGSPKGHMHHMVRKYGRTDKHNRKSFRHTLRKNSDKGFYVTNESDRIFIRNKNGDTKLPYWSHDSVINAFIYKLRRMLLVKGATKTIEGRRYVNYETAHAFQDPRTTQFCKLVEQGIIIIDFDARIQVQGDGLRDHGTKFRISADDLQRLYQRKEQVA